MGKKRRFQTIFPKKQNLIKIKYYRCSAGLPRAGCCSQPGCTAAGSVLNLVACRVFICEDNLGWLQPTLISRSSRGGEVKGGSVVEEKQNTHPLKMIQTLPTCRLTQASEISGPIQTGRTFLNETSQFADFYGLIRLLFLAPTWCEKHRAGAVV